MSSAEKQRRRQRRKQRQSQQDLRRLHERWGSPVVGESGANELPGSPREVLLLSYDITYDPIPQPRDSLAGMLPSGERAELYKQTLNDPAAAIPKLNALLAHAPDSPILLNWLGRCHSALGDTKEAEAMLQRNFERNPDYLFAKINYAQLALQRGDLHQIPVIFDNKLDLKLMYPHRSTFHVSEYLAFASIMAEYYMRIGEHKAAELIAKTMERIDPDNEATRQLRALLKSSLLLRAFQKLSRLTGLERGKE